MSEFVPSRPAADPLSEVTRSERKALLATNVITAVVLYGGFLPTRVTGFGIEIDQINVRTLSFILLGMLLYFLSAFVFYAWADVASYLRDLRPLIAHLAQETMDSTDHLCYPKVERQAGEDPGIAQPTSAEIEASHAKLRQVIGTQVLSSVRPYLYRLYFEIGVPTLATVVNLFWAILLGVKTDFTFR